MTKKFITYGHFAYSEEEISKITELEKVIKKNKDKLYDLHSYDELIDICCFCLTDGQLATAKHIIEALQSCEAEYYRYDTSMGTLEELVSIDDVRELQDAYPEIFKEDNE